MFLFLYTPIFLITIWRSSPSISNSRFLILISARNLGSEWRTRCPVSAQWANGPVAAFLQVLVGEWTWVSLRISEELTFVGREFGRANLKVETSALSYLWHVDEKIIPRTVLGRWILLMLICIGLVGLQWKMNRETSKKSKPMCGVTLTKCGYGFNILTSYSATRPVCQWGVDCIA